MGIELSRPGDEPRRAAVPESGTPHETPHEGQREAPREVQREVQVVRAEDLEPRLGADLPVLGWIPDAQFQLFRFVGLGGWIVLYAVLGPLGLWWVGFLAMWAWIGANVAYENEARRRRRLRRHYRRAVKYGLAVPAFPVAAPPRAPSASTPPAARAASTGPAAPVAPLVSEAEKALVATVRRVDTSDRFERTDVVLVHEVADLLGPLLVRVAERGADPQVRHDLETVAGEHLPRAVDDFLALPRDVARDGPAQELRNQLHLLVEGCRQLRTAVLAADVDRQQQQSRFLETKFRRSDLDL